MKQKNLKTKKKFTTKKKKKKRRAARLNLIDKMNENKLRS